MAEKITAVIKTKNEAEQIGDCIESLSGFADDIIIVDDASTDQTVQIAEQFGAHIIRSRHQDGLIDTLDKEGFEAVSSGWILRMDADERMSPTLAETLKQIASRSNYQGVKFPRCNMMFGDWPKNGGWFKSDQLRFFKAEAWDRNWQCLPHSHPEVGKPVLTLPANENNATIHHDYSSIQMFVKRTLEGYAYSEAQVLYKNGKRFSIIQLFYKPLRKLLGRLFLRKGYKDGKRGVILAGLLAINEFLVQAYLWDIQRGEEK